MNQANIIARTLAYDVILVANGQTMLKTFAKALNGMREYLSDLGEKVSPTKSSNFTSTKRAKGWLANTTWIKINANIDVVDDLRYLGGAPER